MRQSLCYLLDCKVCSVPQSGMGLFCYFKIGTVDFSAYVNALKVTNSNNYTALTNANGDTVVDYINNKRT